MKNIISQISAANFKGQNFDHALAPVTLFHSPDNFSGKSSRIEAITLACLGWLPGVGKKPGDIHADLSSGSLLNVTATVGSHGCVSREWRESRGSIKYLGVGDDLEFPPVALVAQEFLSLSPAERIKFLFSRAKLPAEYSPDSVLKTITANIKNIKLEANTEHSEAVIADLVEFICEPSDKQSTQEMVETLLVAVNDKKKAAVQATQRMEKTQQGMVLIAPDAQAESGAERRFKEAQELVAQCRANDAKIESEGQRLKTELEEAKRLAAGAIPDEEQARKELARLSSEKERIAKLCLTVPDRTKIDAEHARLSSELSEAEVAARDAQAALTAAETRLNKLGSKKDPCCETCGQSLIKIQARLSEELEEQIKDLRPKRVKTSEAVASLVGKLDEVTTKRKAVIAKIEAFNQNQQDFRRLSAEHAKIQERLEKNSAASQAALSVPVIEAKLSAARETWKQQSKALEDAKRQASEAESAYKELVAQRARCQHQELARQELERSRIEAEVLKAAVAMLQELQAKLLEAAIAPLIDFANRVCGNLLKYPLAYNDGDIGFNADGRFYSHRTFSGTEKALAYAAISVALAQGAPLRVVIIDELGRLNAENKIMLLKHVCHLVRAEIIDQAFLVDVQKPDFQDEQFKVIEL